MAEIYGMRSVKNIFSRGGVEIVQIHEVVQFCHPEVITESITCIGLQGFYKTL